MPDRVRRRTRRFGPDLLRRLALPTLELCTHRRFTDDTALDESPQKGTDTMAVTLPDPTPLENTFWLTLAGKALDYSAGLDTHVHRVDPPATVEWHDVGLPGVAKARRLLLPERPHAHTIGSDLNDPRWLDEVPADRPA
ncbi:hypothetical protein ACFFV7_41525 [Nonomuraea spiralis]|uniref:Uncharacterized protein n=1 Tax=Nonomuraea spiralis TaxID=46182 RepID=A0ABV5IT36_9ACTN|nr:hypothetical protein [Nonomuraea spiralis]